MPMGWTRWIWFVGAAAWTLDGLLALHFGNVLHAKIALSLAVLFVGAGYFYTTQMPRNPRD